MTNKEFLESVGIEVKIARIRRKMSTGDVAKLTGLTQSSVSRIERGESDTHILSYKRIADALGVELSTLLQ